MHRRQFIKLAGTAALVGLGSGSVCLSQGSPAKKDSLPVSATKPLDALIGAS